MQNCKSSARTTAKQSSKSSLLFRQPCILAMLLLCAVYCQAQSTFDTALIGNSKLILGNTKAMTLEYKELPDFKFLTESHSQNKPILPEFDTVKVVLLVSDTNHRYREYNYALSCYEVGCVNKKNDHEHFKKIIEDIGNGGSGKSNWQYGYSVRTKHNSNMESNGDWNCWTCKDYMLHSYYLDDNKKPISPTTIVWQSVSVLS